MAIIRFIVEVEVEDHDPSEDLTEEQQAGAVEMFFDIVTAHEDWTPRSYVVCDEPYSVMGESLNCTKEYGHLNVNHSNERD